MKFHSIKPTWRGMNARIKLVGDGLMHKIGMINHVAHSLDLIKDDTGTLVFELCL